jgi:pimeloyl-ACP methyl ester carboxylesterase
MPQRRIPWLAPLAALLALAACALARPTPLEVLRYASGRGQPEANLLVFLRGIGGDHASFAEEGLVADIQSRGLPYDMAAPNAHVGYYADGTLTIRLKTDVIDPARAAGYRRIYLVGVSMGGTGALLYARDYPEGIAGIFLIAPVLGSAEITDEIRAAGGLAAWQPGFYDPAEEGERRLWHWLQTAYAGGSGSGPPLYLGYGEEDHYGDGQRLLDAILPAARVYRTDGGHTVPAFKDLWRRFLEDGFFPAP